MSRLWLKPCCLVLLEKLASCNGNSSIMMPTCSKKPGYFWVLLLVFLSTVAVLVYAAVFSSTGDFFPWTSVCPACVDDPSIAVLDHPLDSLAPTNDPSIAVLDHPLDSSAPTNDPSIAVVLDHPLDSLAPTNLSHIFFGIAGSAKTWHNRRAYSQLWWRLGVTRGYVWLDEKPFQDGKGSSSNNNSSSYPPYRVSADASRFGPRVSAARIARILTESYGLVTEELGTMPVDVRWLVMGDDDTVFFPDNLVSVLGKYDHREPYYIGGSSESVEQDVMHSYGMAFGGGGFAVSIPAAAEMAVIFDRCLVRYAWFYGSDQRVQACMSEVGVPLTREPGFHQLDIRGDPFGLLSAHPVAPLVTLHHLDHVKPIFPGLPTRLQAIRKLVDASKTDPSRALQQSICYERRLNWSVSVSWGYAAVVYPRVIPPRELEVPRQTFTTWRSFKDGPFTFNTRPVEPGSCDRPVVFFLDDRGPQSTRTVTEYVVGVGGRRRKRKCGDRADFLAASKVTTVRVVAARMDPDDWKRRAPRRQCCEVKRSWWGNRLDVRIRKCRRGDNFSPP